MTRDLPGAGRVPWLLDGRMQRSGDLIASQEINKVLAHVLQNSICSGAVLFILGSCRLCRHVPTAVHMEVSKLECS